MIAALVGDPWRLSLEEIGKLTDRQIREIYFHPRNENGAIEWPKPEKPRAARDADDEDAQAVAMMRIFGVPESKIKELVANAKAKRDAKRTAEASGDG